MFTRIILASLKLIVFGFLLSIFNFSYGGENNIAIYLGGGESKSANENSMSFGFVVIPNYNELLWGADFSREGTKLVANWGENDETTSATSYNLLIGKNLYFLDNSRIDIAFLFGARESFDSCPKSNLGYKCTSERSTESKYEFNSGLGLFWSQNKMLFGIRATTVSTQLLIGAKF